MISKRQFVLILLATSCIAVVRSDEARQDSDSDNVLSKRLKDLARVSIQDRDSINDDEIFNRLFPYDTMPRQASPSSVRRNNMILTHDHVDKPEILSRTTDAELFSSPKSSKPSNVVTRENEDTPSVVKKAEASQDEAPMIEKPISLEPKVSPAIQQQERPSLNKSAVDVNKAKSVAFNSREVRLMGPDNTEVEMKDDLATKVAVVFDNLRKETGQFLDQVNVKLDKGWTEFKQSVDKLVEEGRKQVRQL